MGILNLTPDSFFDGGKYQSIDQAVARAWKMVEEGANILDVGAESTRPQAKPIDVETEKQRLFPVLEELLHHKFPLPISVDTRNPLLARVLIEKEWAWMINDVEGFRNPHMVSLAREFQMPLVVMHMHENPLTMQETYSYQNVIEDLMRFFQRRIQELGVGKNVVIDPGIGFGKNREHNLILISQLDQFLSLSVPILVGVSRKSFIGKILSLDVEDRLEGSLAATAISVFLGASIIRTHDVRETVRVVRMTQALRDC